VLRSIQSRGLQPSPGWRDAAGILLGRAAAAAPSPTAYGSPLRDFSATNMGLW